MTFSKLLLYIGGAVIGFCLLGVVLSVATAILQLALVVGLILVVIGLIDEYINKRNKTP
ncbi:MAG: hypothetical protein HYT15_04700 [Candidatus Magasanikbacteria bacterium]|nr:hypothetical protein [Candidatus Magasanikbacteria bacterium]